MKRLTAVLALLLGLALAAGAQPAFRYGVRAGMNLSDARYVGYSASSPSRYSASQGLAAGVSARWFFLPWMGLEADLEVSGLGYWDKDLLNNKVSATYLQLPLVLSMAPVRKKGFALGVEAGGYAAYGISGSIRNEVSSFPYFRVDTYSVAKPLDFGVLGGVYFKIMDRVHVGARYAFGLCNISAGNVADLDALYNEYIQFRLGYDF